MNTDQSCDRLFRWHSRSRYWSGQCSAFVYDPWMRFVPSARNAADSLWPGLYCNNKNYTASLQKSLVDSVKKNKMCKYFVWLVAKLLQCIVMYVLTYMISVTLIWLMAGALRPHASCPMSTRSEDINCVGPIFRSRNSFAKTVCWNRGLWLYYHVKNNKITHAFREEISS